MGIILFKGWYSPELCEANPDKIFLFGDNTRGFGMGGQAIIRNQPNAFGVPTKRKPSMAPGSFFNEGDSADLEVVMTALEKVWADLKAGATVVVPLTEEGRVSLGCERAELPERAPSIYATIETHVAEMAKAFGSKEVDGGIHL